MVGKALVQRRSGGVHSLQIRPLGQGPTLPRQSARIPAEPYDRAVLVEQRVVLPAGDTAPSGGEDCPGGFPPLRERLRLQTAEALLPALGEDLGDSLSRQSLNAPVRVLDRPSGEGGEPPSGGFPGHGGWGSRP